MPAIRNQSRVLLVCILATLASLTVIWQLVLVEETESQRFVRHVLHKENHLQQRRRRSIHEACRTITASVNNAIVPVNADSDATASSSQRQLLRKLIPYLDHFIVDDANQLIYCFVPKVASTNWKRVLMALKRHRRINDNPLQILGNETHAQNAFKLLSQHDDVDVVYQKLRTYLKFMFVRHPYERLLSAYRNKFEITWSDYFRTRFGRKIVKHFRKNATQESLERGHDVTFSEFLNYVLNLSSANHKIAFNEHWRPIYDLCFPCLLDYDVIGRSETLIDDADYVLHRLGVLDFVKFPTRAQTYNTMPSSSLLAKYYSRIDRETMAQLAKLYAHDMKLFNYSATIDLT